MGDLRWGCLSSGTGSASLLSSGVLGRMAGIRHKSFVLSALDVELLDAVEKALVARIPAAVVLPYAVSPP